MEWTLTTTGGKSPSAREGHAMAAVGTDVFLFGGFTGTGQSGGSVRREGWLYV